MVDEIIPFNRPYMTGKELDFIAEAKFNNMLAGDGPFTKRCQKWIEDETGCRKSLLTHSCTAALEMAALAIDIKPGDEVVIPSFTFVSTANAFALRGGVPVFVDIRDDTLNMDERLVEAAVTSRTRAIVPVHYAGVACEMEAIGRIAHEHGLFVIEDAAQGVMATYHHQHLGAIGDLGAFSFHETKNVMSGEGGALLVNDPNLINSAEIIREKGTDRSRYFRGEVDKYTWQMIGSSFLPGEIVAAFLWAQLAEAQTITSQRMELWHYYHNAFAELEIQEIVRRPRVPYGCNHNAHMYYVLLNPKINRDALLRTMKDNGVHSVFHYVPLHSSPGGLKYGRVSGSMSITDIQSSRLIRLPMWIGMTKAKQDKVLEVFRNAAYQELRTD